MVKTLITLLLTVALVNAQNHRHRRVEFGAYRFGNVALYLDAKYMGGAGTNDGAAVTTWRDLGPNGNNAVQSTAGSKPLYSNSWANASGQAILSFDGTDDWMNVLALSLDTFHSGLWIAHNEAPGRLWLEHGTNVAHIDQEGFAVTDANLAFVARDAGSHNYSRTGWGTNKWLVMLWTYGGSGTNYSRTNGVTWIEDTVAGTARASSLHSTNLYIGARGGFDRFMLGETSALWLKNAQLQVDQLILLENHFRRRFKWF